MMTPEQDSNAKLMVNALAKHGINNPFLQSGILATVSKEGGFAPRGAESSYKGTPNARIRKIFGSRLAKYSEDQLTALKQNDVAFFDAVYGKDTAIGLKNGNTNVGDGYKYRGRGFNQITFKSAYQNLGNQMGVDLVSNPDLLTDPKYGVEALALFFKDSIASGVKLGKFKKFGVNTVDDIKTLEQGTQVAIQSNAGVGTDFNNSTVQEGFNKAMSVVSDFYNTYAGKVVEIAEEAKKKIEEHPAVTIIITAVLIVSGFMLYKTLIQKKTK